MPDPHVSESDAFTMSLERDPGLRATIVAVALLDRPPDWDRLADRMARAVELVPMFRQRLVPSPLRLATPRWVDDPDFDLTWHLRHLRLVEGADLSDVLQHARTAAMAAFDPARPRWTATVLEGLPGGGAAIVMKVHHALTDGIGGIQIIGHVVDLDRIGPDLGGDLATDAASASVRSAVPGPVDATLEALGHDARSIAAIGWSALRAVPGAAIGAVRRPVATASGVVAEVQSVARMVRPVTETRSPVMTGRSILRHFEVLDLALDDLRAGAARAGGTVNDGFLAGIAGGMRRYHERHGTDVASLRVAMPISVRTHDDGVGGNHVTLVRFDLPVELADPVERTWAIHDICAAQRHEPAIARSEAIAGILNLLPVGITAGMLRHVDLLASNVPGFDADVFVAGAKLQAFYPFGATLGSAANITLLSINGTCHIGIDTDVAAVPDPEVFTDCLRAGFAEVCG